MNYEILVGDALERLRELPAESVQCVVTSPPYWGLRDYGTATWEGGDAGCDHVERMARQDERSIREIDAASGRRPNAESYQSDNRGAIQYRSFCKCGARRIDAQLGLERTPEEYVGRLVEVFREVRRVLRKDGTLWLNLGDSYAGSSQQGGDGGRTTLTKGGKPHASYPGMLTETKRPLPVSLKPKDLVGIPWRVAFALQADGWYLRSDIIWSKPNPMPESVTDRPTKSHEYVFLLTKAASYYFDQEAVREPHVRIWDETNGGTFGGTSWMKDAQRIQGGRGNTHNEPSLPHPAGRNIRSVWTIATQPFPEAHFATFPEALAERCIKAGTKEGDVVLDPFCGSGTSGAVAVGLQRDFIGIELNPAYVEMARKRIGGVAPLFAEAL